MFGAFGTCRRQSDWVGFSAPGVAVAGLMGLPSGLWVQVCPLRARPVTLLSCSRAGLAYSVGARPVGRPPLVA